MKIYSKNSGFSLVELLLVLGVIAVLLVAAFVVYPKVRDAARINAEVANITTIKAALNKIYGTQFGNYKNLSTKVANQARVFPQSMNGGDYQGDGVTSSWGGNVLLSASPQLTSPYRVQENRAFMITYERVPAAVCLGMIQSLSEHFMKITINNVDVITAQNGAKPSLDVSSFTLRCVSAPAPPTLVFYSE